MNRRIFLKRSVLASGVLFVPSFLKRLDKQHVHKTDEWKNLVVIQLSGGNDGLNTIVPFENDIYYNNRPVIAVEKSTVIKLNELLGFNPCMRSLKEIYDSGYMCIINNVGYPNPDRSHFRSLDIWHTGSSSDEYLNTGWIGRYLDSSCSGCNNPHFAIECDDSLSLAMKGHDRKGMAVKDAKLLYYTTREPFFRSILNLQKENSLSKGNLDYLYKTMIETSSSAEYIYETQKTYENKSEYPQTKFAHQLKTVSTFINSGLNTRVYYVSLSGFDTHTYQTNQQERLLKEFSEGVSAFLKDLKQTSRLDETLVVTFSEFGRRVEQNASNGTDHGTAGNMFVFGSKLNKLGIYNDAPDLTDLEDGDLKYTTDFRSVYATVLEKWLSVSPYDILNNNFPKLDFI